MSASHRTASFAVLERLTAAHPDPAAHLADDGVQGAVLVTTCNRVEAYLDVAAQTEAQIDAAVSTAIERLATAAGIDPGELRARSRTMSSSRVAAHLFAVASGLDSVVVGEDEIAGQVRRALADARAAGATTTALERLFQMASTTSRGVKNTTGINAAGRSMVRLALDLTESRIPQWAGARVLIIGTGAYARTTLAALRERGVSTVDVASPSGREQQFASREGVRPVGAGEVPAALGRADLIITSTNQVALDAGRLAPARRGERPLLIIDLGLPGNVTKDVTGLPGVDLLDLETISLHAPVAELNASAQAHDLVAAATREYETRTAAETAAPAIVAYRGRIEELLEAELARARARGEHTEEVERALRHFAGVLVHSPTARVRDLATQGRLPEATDALAALYGLHVPPHDEKTLGMTYRRIG
ncbi:glutamyl-tRNA reductase [Occultella glacieicola]|uniref:glutamyl-tRNA reductase n=1 Tax=Occultella glacieicola TaxID=2518684 RepID=UPI001F417B8C|nr:glutamyl-tRNA reductase [Occultella glacieicola]